MEAVIFIGIQATGKSTFYRERFGDSHIRLNLDMLKTRHRENILLNACLKAKQPFVVDNTNPSVEDRKKYIQSARSNRFKIIGYYFQSKLRDSILRNKARNGNALVPERAIGGTSSRLQLPSRDEGFDELYYVAIAGDNSFSVLDWKDEI